MREIATNTILLLDDDKFFRAILADRLSEFGLTVLEARTAKDATACVMEHRPALVVVDYRLPGMDGVTWIQQMREQGLKIPLILLTGASIDNKTLNLLRGLYDVGLILKKPVEIDSFVEHIRLLAPVTCPAPTPPPGKCLAKQEWVLPPERVVSVEVMPNQAVIERLISQRERRSQVLARRAEKEDSRQTSPGVHATPSEQSDKPSDSKPSDQEAMPMVSSDVKAANYKTRLQQSPNFAGLLVAYLDKLCAESGRLDALLVRWTNNLNADALAEVMNLAHQIRGSAGSYGLPSIGEVCGRIEDMMLALELPVSRENAIATYSEVVAELIDLDGHIEKELKAIESRSVAAKKPVQMAALSLCR